MPDEIRLIDFNPSHQTAAANLVNTGLGEHFGFVDESMNPDLFDIAQSYRDGHFLLAFDGELIIGTGGLVIANDELGQIVRMHTALNYRRRGIATQILQALENRALSRGLRCLMLETNLDWSDAIVFYGRAGYTELKRDEFEIYFRKTL